MLNRLTDALDFQAQALTLRSERQRLIASNIANADTPGYLARDMDFAQALQAATGALAGAQSVSTTPRRPYRQRRRRLSGGRVGAELLYATAGPDQPRPQHRRHGPRARQLRRQRGQVRSHAALHQRQRAHQAVARSPASEGAAP